MCITNIHKLFFLKKNYHLFGCLMKRMYLCTRNSGVYSHCKYQLHP